MIFDTYCFCLPTAVMRKRLKISFIVTLPDLLRNFIRINVKLISRKNLTHEMKYKWDTNIGFL